jgi:hypothetical protein
MEPRINSEMQDISDFADSPLQSMESTKTQDFNVEPPLPQNFCDSNNPKNIISYPRQRKQTSDSASISILESLPATPLLHPDTCKNQPACKDKPDFSYVTRSLPPSPHSPPVEAEAYYSSATLRPGQVKIPRHWSQVLNSPFKSNWIEALDTEANSFLQLDVFKEVTPEDPELMQYLQEGHRNLESLMLWSVKTCIEGLVSGFICICCSRGDKRQVEAQVCFEEDSAVVYGYFMIPTILRISFLIHVKRSKLLVLLLSPY